MHSLCQEIIARGVPPSSCSVNGVLLECGRNGLHDFLSLDLIVDLESEQVSGGPELELCDAVSLVLLDSDPLSAGEVFLLSTHDLDELLQILDFLGLKARLVNLSISGGESAYHYYVFLIYNKY